MRTTRTRKAKQTAEHPVGILGGALESSTDNRPNGSECDGLDTPISITEPTSDQGSHQCAGKIVDGDLNSR